MPSWKPYSRQSQDSASYSGPFGLSSIIAAMVAACMSALCSSPGQHSLPTYGTT